MAPLVTVEVIRGPAAGRDAVVEPGFSVIVGRLPDCNLSIQNDPTISRRHCEFSWRGEHLYVINLSNNGVTVNGRPADQARLSDGDIVTFGATTALKVHIGENARPQKQQARFAETLETPSFRNLAPIACRKGVTPSGIVTLQLAGASPSSPDLLECLRHYWPLNFILKLKAGESDSLSDFSKCPALLNWLPIESQRQYSPLVIHQPNQSQLAQLLELAERNPIAVLSTQKPEVVLQHLRQYAGAFSNADGLRPQLTETTPELAAALMTDLDAIMVIELEGGWTLYMTDEFFASLSTLGFNISDEAAQSKTVS